MVKKNQNQCSHILNRNNIEGIVIQFYNLIYRRDARAAVKNKYKYLHVLKYNQTFKTKIFVLRTTAVERCCNIEERVMQHYKITASMIA